MSSFCLPIQLTLLTITHATLIVHEPMENCVMGEWVSTPDYVEHCFNSSDCLSLSNLCTSIFEHSLIYATFSITNYSAISIKYDINVGADDSLDAGEDSEEDYIYVFYSCKNNSNVKLTEYTGKQSHFNQRFDLSSDCDHYDSLSIYFLALTDSSLLSESAEISDLYIYGNIGTDNQYKIPNNTNIEIFHDSMKDLDYTGNWETNIGTITPIQSDSSEAAFCIIPPCSKFHPPNSKIISSYISTIGYTNLKIFYELYTTPNLKSEDIFVVHYKCTGLQQQLQYYDAATDGKPFFGNATNLPSDCDNITNLQFSFNFITGEYDEDDPPFVTIRNINVFGDLLETHLPISTTSSKPDTISTYSSSKPDSTDTTVVYSHTSIAPSRIVNNEPISLVVILISALAVCIAIICCSCGMMIMHLMQRKNKDNKSRDKHESVSMEPGMGSEFNKHSTLTAKSDEDVLSDDIIASSVVVGSEGDPKIELFDLPTETINDSNQKKLGIINYTSLSDDMYDNDHFNIQELTPIAGFSDTKCKTTSTNRREGNV